MNNWLSFFGGGMGDNTDYSGAGAASSFTDAPTDASMGEWLGANWNTMGSTGYGELPTMGSSSAQMTSPMMGSTAPAVAENTERSSGYQDVRDYATIQNLMNMASNNAKMTPEEYKDLPYQSNALNRMLKGY